MTYHDLEIPPFLKRKKRKKDEKPILSTDTAPQKPEYIVETLGTSLTGARKDRLAREIIAAVRDGHDTFGKIRDALGHDDRLLKAGIRHAKTWQTDLQRSGSRHKPKHTRRQTRLESVGRRYKVISTL